MPRSVPCQVLDILEHGDRVYSVYLKPSMPVPRFRAGQFLHLALDTFKPGDFWPESRPFSIASAPTDRERLRISYAVKGTFTTRMESELRPRREVWIKLPFGEFAVDLHTDSCLLAGGTGITAFSAFIEDLQPTSSPSVYLFYGARNPRLLIYRPIIEGARQRCSQLHATFLAEEDFAGTDCAPGIIDLEQVWAMMRSPALSRYYIAGPPEMIRQLTLQLRQRGVSPTNVIIDAWQ